MNEIIQMILNRRSCRSFTDEAVSREEVQTLLDCALHAPSGMGLQTWKFVAVMDRAKIQKLAKVVAKVLGRGDGYNMYDPAVLILTANDKESAFSKEDNACAMENIYLAAEAMGLGCVWINQLKDIADDVEVRKVLTELHIPENYHIYGCAAVGHRAENAKPKEIKGIAEIIE